MKYSFTGTVKNNDKIKIITPSNLILVLFILIWTSPYIFYSTGYLTEVIYVILFGIVVLLWIAMNEFIKDKKEIDANDPYFRGVIVKVKLYDDYIQITKLGRIPWDNVKYIKERAYVSRREGMAKAIEIVFEHEKGRKRIYLIETPISQNSRCRYVNTMVDPKTYDDVLSFLSNKSILLGMFGA